MLHLLPNKKRGRKVQNKLRTFAGFLTCPSWKHVLALAHNYVNIMFTMIFEHITVDLTSISSSGWFHWMMKCEKHSDLGWHCWIQTFPNSDSLASVSCWEHFRVDQTQVTQPQNQWICVNVHFRPRQEQSAVVCSICIKFLWKRNWIYFFLMKKTTTKLLK